MKTPSPLVLAFVLFGSGMPGGRAAAAEAFEASRESFQRYECPEWFRDAKFGIWAHWGPQCVPEDGDWYARRLYLSAKPKVRGGIPEFEPGSAPDRGNKLHVERYGHPSKFGYKDIIPLWKAEKWNPDKLMDLYAKAGAKYFVSMAVHHDNFDLWDSKYQPRWNAVQTGPKRDVVGDWQKAAQRRGLKFGVSEHLAASFTWFQANKGADISGPLAGVPYDGNDPQNQDLYHPPTAPDDREWLTKNPVFHETWYRRIQDLVDRYHPELLYSDSQLPFGNVGERLVAHYYNGNRAFNGGRLTAVYTCKETPKPTGWVRDIERGVMEAASPEPWQTDTSIGDWYYRKGEKYKSATQIIQMLVDIVSKNGTLLINVVQKADGEITPEAQGALEQMAAWMAINGESIYATRPWQVYGEGPAVEEKPEAGRFGGAKDVRSKPYVAQDLRFTRSKDGKTVYAIALAWPSGPLTVKSARVAKASPHAEVRLLGHPTPLKYRVNEAGALVVDFPAKAPCDHAYALKLTGFEFAA
ncbi:MAG: alpha-L-fucosidase, partial [Verrucomicrobia bacterium]|nr:alpha-L-fucosidase [Verrucomicrobiota bacterium]